MLPFPYVSFHSFVARTETFQEHIIYISMRAFFLILVYSFGAGRGQEEEKEGKDPIGKENNRTIRVNELASPIERGNAYINRHTFKQKFVTDGLFFLINWKRC